MSVQLGVIMDPIQSIHVEKDSTFALLLEAQKRGCQLFYIEQQNLFLRNGVVFTKTQKLRVKDDPENWYSLDDIEIKPLDTCDVVLMRKDPPVNKQYIHTTQLLDLVEKQGTLVLNKPQSLRDFNEKLFVNWFPECCAPTLTTADMAQAKIFLGEFKDVIAKPLDGMGGYSVFRVKSGDANINVIFEMLSDNGNRLMILQQYIPEVSAGDKRIILIDGEPVPYALARLAPAGETRANIAVGGKGAGVELTKRDRWICERIGPFLKSKGLWWVGIDVIGDYLTEINITSPTCIREIDKIFGLNIAAQLMECLLKKLPKVS